MDALPTEAIVWDLRLPRVLTAMLIGCGLAVAGATFQGLLRNPLADPYVLGTASGRRARCGDRGPAPGPARRSSSSACSTGSRSSARSAPAWLVFRLGGTGGTGGPDAIAADRLRGRAPCWPRVLTMAMYVSGVELRQIFSFLLGGLGGSSWVRLLVAAPLILGSMRASS